MVLYNLDSYQILTLSAILVPSLSTIWVIFLQKDLPEKIVDFRKHLKEYRKKKSNELLTKIIEDLATIKDSKNNDSEKFEQSFDVIMEYSDEWLVKKDAIRLLLSKEKQVYKVGKCVIILLGFIFVTGIYSSALPNQFILGSVVTRIDATQLFFGGELILVVYWIWIIFNFSFMLNKVQSGEIDDIEETLK